MKIYYSTCNIIYINIKADTKDGIRNELIIRTEIGYNEKNPSGLRKVTL